MKLLLFEWLSGGGTNLGGNSPQATGPLLAQGVEMLTDLATDAMREGLETVCVVDDRVQLPIPGSVLHTLTESSSLKEQLESFAESVDLILFVAPETDGALELVCNWLSPWQNKWLCPDIEFVRWASNKHATGTFLESQNVPTPRRCLLGNFHGSSRTNGMVPPLVIKPIDGAGGEHVSLVDNLQDFDWPDDPDRWVVEEFVAGNSVSVGVHSSGSELTIFRPTGQTFDSMPFGNYSGCRFPLPIAIERRARELAEQAVEAMPPTTGLYGIDMVIGDSRSVVIEVNPRITVSYRSMVDEVGLPAARYLFGTRLDRSTFDTGSKQF